MKSHLPYMFIVLFLEFYKGIPVVLSQSEEEATTGSISSTLDNIEHHQSTTSTTEANGFYFNETESDVNLIFGTTDKEDIGSTSKILNPTSEVTWRSTTDTSLIHSENSTTKAFEPTVSTTITQDGSGSTTQWTTKQAIGDTSRQQRAKRVRDIESGTATEPVYSTTSVTEEINELSSTPENTLYSSIPTVESVLTTTSSMEALVQPTTEDVEVFSTTALTSADSSTQSPALGSVILVKDSKSIEETTSSSPGDVTNESTLSSSEPLNLIVPTDGVVPYTPVVKTPTITSPSREGRQFEGDKIDLNTTLDKASSNPSQNNPSTETMLNSVNSSSTPGINPTTIEHSSENKSSTPEINKSTFDLKNISSLTTTDGPNLTTTRHQHHFDVIINATDEITDYILRFEGPCPDPEGAPTSCQNMRPFFQQRALTGENLSCLKVMQLRFSYAQGSNLADSHDVLETFKELVGKLEINYGQLKPLKLVEVKGISLDFGDDNGTSIGKDGDYDIGMGRLTYSEFISYIVIGCCFGCIILFAFCLLFAKCFKNRNQGSHFRNNPHLSLRLEDYRLTKIPRPTTIYNSEHDQEGYGAAKHDGRSTDTNSIRLSSAYDTAVIPLDDLQDEPGSRYGTLNGHEMQTFRSRSSPSKKANRIKIGANSTDQPRKVTKVSVPNPDWMNLERGRENPVYRP